MFTSLMQLPCMGASAFTPPLLRMLNFANCYPNSSLVRRVIDSMRSEQFQLHFPAALSPQPFGMSYADSKETALPLLVSSTEVWQHWIMLILLHLQDPVSMEGIKRKLYLLELCIRIMVWMGISTDTVPMSQGEILISSLGFFLFVFRIFLNI